jgi:hypothetical protein
MGQFEILTGLFTAENMSRRGFAENLCINSASRVLCGKENGPRRYHSG